MLGAVGLASMVNPWCSTMISLYQDRKTGPVRNVQQLGWQWLQWNSAEICWNLRTLLNVLLFLLVRADWIT